MYIAIVLYRSAGTASAQGRGHFFIDWLSRIDFYLIDLGCTGKLFQSYKKARRGGRPDPGEESESNEI